MKLGDIINTHHGKATVVGFERFDDKGMTAPMADTWTGEERILCELSEADLWPGFSPLYAVYPHEYKELNP